MPPKQQAAKLRYLMSIELGLSTTDEKVIKCALITVDEILNTREFNLATEDYWKEVKTQLENKL